MNTAQTIQSLDQIKALADPHRMAIMGQLMAERATLSQLATSLQHSPAWIRHHLLILEKAGLVELIEIRKSGRVTEKYYQASTSAVLIQRWVLPQSREPILIFSGSHDLALEMLSSKVAGTLSMMILPIGSLNGLISLRQGVCQLAGAHILDSISGEYNVPTLRQLFPDYPVQAVTLAHRTQGLMVAAGNPKGIHTLEDLARGDVRFINRNLGSGTRLWLDMALRRLNISSDAISGYQDQVNTHTLAASKVWEGKADTTLGLYAAAHRLGLDFIPLFEERYDLVYPADKIQALSPILDMLPSKSFRQTLRSLPGYNAEHSGEAILL